MFLPTNERVIERSAFVKRSVRQMKRLYDEPLEGVVILENGKPVTAIGADGMDLLCAWWAEQRKNGGDRG